MPKHSIVVPVYNEVAGLEMLFKRLQPILNSIDKSHDTSSEIILVNDGSRDGSTEVLDQIFEKDSRFKVVHLSRNFGHQVAITAGMQCASGDTVTVMDADLQDPPEVILNFIQKWHEGYDVVYGMRRRRDGETPFKLWTAKLFYRIIRKLTQVEIPIDTGDFRLMDKKVVQAFLQLPEKHRFIRGLVSWVGFKQTGVLYDRAKREFGETHYPFRKMLKFALDGVTSFSIFPLQLATYIGFITAVLSFIGVLYTVYYKLFTNQTIQGWTSIMAVVLFIGGVQLLALGVIGEYLGRTYDEVRRRPLYFIARSKGL